LNLTNDKKLILLVEDDIDVLESVRELLVDFGYDVVTASDGLLAVEKYDEHKPDLVLMDFLYREQYLLLVVPEQQIFLF